MSFLEWFQRLTHECVKFFTANSTVLNFGNFSLVFSTPFFRIDSEDKMTTIKSQRNRPLPLEGESFSSWFRRLAAANGLSARHLYRALMPGAQLFTYDLDRHACPSLVSALTSETGVEEASLLDLKLQRWDGTIGPSVEIKEKMLWRPPAGRDGSSRSFGQQICALCLEEDHEPHYRAIWRLGFSTICTKHMTLLLDRCPSCGEPIQSLRSDTISHAHLQCWKCQVDYRSSTRHNSIEYFQSLDLFERALRDGWAWLGDHGFVHSVVLFDLANILFRLLVSGRHAGPLRLEVSKRHPDLLIKPPSIPRLKEAERLNTRCRHAMLMAVSFLLTDWPQSFVDVCRDAKITAKDLIKGNRTYPFPYSKAIECHLMNGRSIISPGEVAAASTYLARAALAPTRKNLEACLGRKFSAAQQLVAPARNCAKYGTSRYWKLDGVSADVRSGAKRAAKQDGENVGTWVDKTLRRVLTGNTLQHII